MQRSFLIALLIFATLVGNAQTELPKDFKFSLNELTVGQFEQLTTMVGKTKYKDSVELKTNAGITLAQLSGIYNALRDLPYKDVFFVIDALLATATRQVETLKKDAASKGGASVPKEGKKE